MNSRHLFCAGLILRLVGPAILANESSALNETSSLVAHWTFDEPDGDVAKDLAGHGHDATLQEVSRVPSPRGHAARFESGKSQARYARVDSMNLVGDVTLAVWVKADAAVGPGSQRVIFGDLGAGVTRNMNLRIDQDGLLRFEWSVDGEEGNGISALTYPGTALNGFWRHVTVVSDLREKRVTLYIDGVEVAHLAEAKPFRKTLARDRVSGNWPGVGVFRGEIDDLRLYSRALAATEIKALFESQADLQVSTPRVLLDVSQEGTRGVVQAKVHNWSDEARELEFVGDSDQRRVMSLSPGGDAEVTLSHAALQPVWSKRDDLYVCEPAKESAGISGAVNRGNQVDKFTLSVPGHALVEPLKVLVKEVWKHEMTLGRTKEVELDIALAVAEEQLRAGFLQLKLISRETEKEVLLLKVHSPLEKQPMTLDVRSLPWGAYDLMASFHDGSGRAVVSTKRLVTILPDGKQQIQPLNNLVTELMDAGKRGLLQNRQIEFMNPRDGWVWFSVSGSCSLEYGAGGLMEAKEGGAAVEAMRFLPAGKQVLQINGNPTDLIVRAVPFLVYNTYPSTAKVQPFGKHTWARLSKHMLPNCNTIESPQVDSPEFREWIAQGKLWFANVQAPGLLDEKPWTSDKLLDLWFNPGSSTAWPERPNITLPKISGMQVDEYYPTAASLRFLAPTVVSLARLAEEPRFNGKFWIPFMAGRFGATPDNLLLKVVLGSGWPFAEEVHLGSYPTESQDVDSIRASLLGIASAYESNHPGSLRRMIFTPMYSSLPPCTSSRNPQADFRVHLDMQMQFLATHPTYFGLGGIQPYRSNYVDEEMLNCMGRMLRHYCIEGKTDRMLSSPYELRYLKNADFENGVDHWNIEEAELGGVDHAHFAGYGTLQGRYPAATFGDAFLRTKRSGERPNVVSQSLNGLQPGRVYSVKVITADYADLAAGVSTKNPQAINLHVEGADVLPGAFSYPFESSLKAKPFTKSSLWMTFHWLRFRAHGPNAKLSISDWINSEAPGGPAGQQVIYNFVEVRPVSDE